LAGQKLYATFWKRHPISRHSGAKGGTENVERGQKRKGGDLEWGSGRPQVCLNDEAPQSNHGTRADRGPPRFQFLWSADKNLG